MSLKKFFLFSGACIALGTYLIQAPPPGEGEKVLSSRGSKTETAEQRLVRVRKEAFEKTRELAQQKRAGKSRPISFTLASSRSDLSAPLLSGDRSDSSLSDDARQADEVKFNEGVARAHAFHATQEHDARLTSGYLQKQLDLEDVEKFERDDLVANFNKDTEAQRARDAQQAQEALHAAEGESDRSLSRSDSENSDDLFQEDRSDLDKEIDALITPEDIDAVKDMSPEERQKIDDFIKQILLEKNDQKNAPYGNEDEMSHAQIEAANKERIAQERAEIEKFIQKVLAEPEVTEEELQQKLHKYDSGKFAKSSPASGVASVDTSGDEDDGPIFTQEPDDNESIVFTERGSDDESSVDSRKTVAHMVDAAVQHEEVVISHVQAELARIDETLKDPKSTEGAKKEAEGRAQSLSMIAASGERLLDRVETAHEAEVKSGGWYDKFVTQRNMLKALSIGLKAASVGIVGYGIFKSLSSGSRVSTDVGSAVSTVASVPVSVSRGSNLEGLAFKAPTHGGWFAEHKTIPTDYSAVYKAAFGGGK